MTPFAKFLYLNEIQKKTIADYLQVSGSLVTQMCSGARKLSEANLKKISENPNWDITPLLEENTSMYSSPEQDLAVANARIEYLESQVERLQKINDEYWATIRKLLDK